MIDFACTGCGTEIHVVDSLAGRKGKCRRCGSIIQVPTGAVALSEQAVGRTSANLPRPVGQAGLEAGQPRVISKPIDIHFRAGVGSSSMRLDSTIASQGANGSPALHIAEILRTARSLRRSARILNIVASLTLIIGIITLAIVATGRLEAPSLMIGGGIFCVFVAIATYAFAGFLRLCSHPFEAICGMSAGPTQSSPAVGAEGASDEAGHGGRNISACFTGQT
jgi:ribosomal protein S27E